MSEKKELLEKVKEKISGLKKNTKIMIGGGVGLLILVSLMGGETYYERIKKLDSNFESSLMNGSEIKQLYKEWKEESKKKNGVEEVEFKIVGSSCPSIINDRVFDDNKQFNDNYKEIPYRKFKYNDKEYWLKGTKYIKGQNYQNSWSKKYYTCFYEATKKDKSIEIVD